MSKTGVREMGLFGVLLLALLATRGAHFGSAVSLGDATLAVMFLAGLYLGRALWLPVLLLACAGADWFALHGGTSGWCVTAAYGFLIPAYGAVWLAGRLLHGSDPLRGRGLMRSAAALVAGVSLFFVISNAGFYAASGYFENMGAAHYARSVAGYYWPYLAHALLYVGAAFAVHAVLRLAGARQQLGAPS